MSRPIFRFGRTRQYAQREDGVWFYRVRDEHYRHWGRWIMCPAGRPIEAWYDPRAGRAHLPKDPTA